MRFNKLDLNLLVALDALLNERNVSRAAEKVFLSQSTMSNALSRLREHFGDELLVQVGRKMELTPRAETLRDPVRDVLVRITSTIDIQPHFDPATSDREFVIYASDYSMETLFPHVFALAEKQRSRVRVKLLPQGGNPTRSLERGEVDLLLIPEAYCSPDHPTELVLTEEFCCVMWRDSQMSREPLTIDRYIRARHIVMEPPNTGHTAFENSFVQRHGITRRIEVSTYSFTAMTSMVVGSELIATVHGRLARRSAVALPIVIRPVPFEMPPLKQTLQWHKYRSNDPGLIWLRELIKSAALQIDVPSQAEGKTQAQAAG